MNPPYPDWEELFVRDARKPLAWHVSASQLRRVAEQTWRTAREALGRQLEWTQEIIRKHGVPSGPFELSGEEARQALDATLHGIAFMLAGFAVENLAKGVLISRDPDLVDESGSISSRISTHDLQALVSQCLGDLSPRENVVLEEVATLIRWRGRYPVPLESDVLRNQKMQARKRGRTLGHDKEGDWKVLGGIHRRLEEELW